MISLKNVSFSYVPGSPVLTDFSLAIPEGKRLCLYGESGRGKTTVLRLLMGLEKPDKGSIEMPEGLRFSAVFQEDRLLPWLNIAENAAMFAEKEKARRILCELGLEELLKAMPDELSGGQRRRASLARALAHEGDVFLLDEPLTGLDQKNEESALSLIDRIAADKTLILVSHHQQHAERLGAEMVRL
ncbi:MAG: ATP-binding cassette domain-containing protein [Lachnospiraceae bacterium]|nr:ATP-binding cassette domain-containing protein [Lachnospiraceae bacterium]